MEKIYVCRHCGKEFRENEKQKYCGHSGSCGKHKGTSWNKGLSSWNKGKTKETDESVKRTAEKASARLKAMGDKNPWIVTSKNKERKREINKKQSETRKRLFREGKLKISERIGRGKGSYFIYKGNKFYLRSTYEFIFALYLLYKGIDFNYGNVTVNYNNKTRFSDFQINGKLFEIKGRLKKKGYTFEEIKEAFIKNGYKIRIVYAETIDAIKKYLERRNFKMNFYLDMIKKMVDKKERFIFKEGDIDLLKTTEYL
jgi:hypothetical protein